MDGRISICIFGGSGTSAKAKTSFRFPEQFIFLDVVNWSPLTLTC